tara:strand:- start:27326 stop:27556 length:231 start_codon:yes stop_codon:yes gene_type:complete
MKIPAKFRMLVFPFLMTFSIGISLSGILLFVREGFVDDFFQKWMSNFISTWLIVLPVALVVIPIVNRITDAIVEKQ